MYVLLVLIGIAVAIVIVLNLPVFGKSPRGARLERIKKSPNYRDGSFQNQSLTPTLPPDLSYWQVLKKVMKGNPNGSPKRVLPHGKQHFERSEDLKITWFGHSSY
ncbi:MAG: MBL fold metallo-hydrolase, partial [Pedobacter sp.]|nr:MBL fold metallo-hydrolase [Pedobacter sp.]